MPRAPRISNDDAVCTLVEKYPTILTSTNLPNYSDPVWKKLAMEYDGKWTAHNWYNKLKKDDNNGILSLARRKLQLNLSQNSTFNETVNSSLNDSRVEFVIHEREKRDGESFFRFFLKKEEWSLFNPLQMENLNQKLKCTLHPGPWCNVTDIAFWKQNRLPCVFVFDGAVIDTLCETFLKIQGHCKSSGCKNEFYGFCNEKPRVNNTDLLIHVRAKDTRGVVHEDMQFELNAARKERFEEEKTDKKKEERCSTRKKKNSSLPTKPTEEISENLIKNIYHMQFQQRYLGSIDNISFSPLYIHYGSTANVIIYKTYSTSTRSTSISIGKIDELIKEVVRPKGLPPSEVSLLTIAIKFDNTVIALFNSILNINQFTVEFYIKRWLRRIKSRPRQVTIPYEEVMISACSKGFNDLVTNRYIDKTFHSIVCNNQLPETLTVLKIDFQDILKITIQCTCLKSIESRGVRNFYIKCVTLIAKSRDLEEFKELFMLTCAVAVQNYKDSIISVDTDVKVDDARKKLQSMFSRLDDCFPEMTKNIGTQMNVKTVASTMHILADSSSKSEKFLFELMNNLRNMDEIPETAVEFIDCETSKVEELIMKLILSTFGLVKKGNELNAYFLPGIVSHLYVLGKCFPMWTDVAMPPAFLQSAQNHAQKYVEEIKKSVLLNFKDLPEVDKFLEFHMNSLLQNEVKNSSKLHANDAEQENEKIKTNSRESINNNTNTNSYSNPSTVYFYLENKKDHQTHVSYQETPPSEEDTNPNFATQQKIPTPQNDARYECEAEREERKKDKLETMFYNMFEQKQSQAKFFKDYLEVKIANESKTKSTNIFFLRNGHLVPPSLLNDRKYQVKNTCGFDSICRILLMTAVADTHFYDFVSKSDNLMMKLIVNIINNKSPKDIWINRLEILLPYYKQTMKHIGTDRREILSQFDAEDNLLNIFKNVMKFEYSAITVLECSKCGDTLGTRPSFSPNHWTIERFGFKKLQDALNFLPLVCNVQCSKCTGKGVLRTIPNTYIFIDLDVRRAQNNNVSVRGQLKDFPIEIDMGHKYRLAGIIHYEMGHFIAYSRKLSGYWESYNDILRNVETCTENVEVEPHGAIYVLQRS